MSSHIIGTIKAPVITLVFALALTACGQAPGPDPTATPPVPTPTSSPTETPVPTPTSLPEIDLDPTLPEGDAEAGYLASIRYSCYGCHAKEDHPDSGPRFSASAEVPAIAQRGEVRIADPDYTGRATSNREYLIESILQPDAHLIPGDWREPMSNLAAMVMTEEELADILAWMGTFE